MTLANYLETPQAREDVRHILSCGVPSAQWFPATKTRISEFVLGAWIRILITAERHSISACYRPDGDRYVVTDLGEGVRAACLRGLDLANAEHFERLNALGRTLDDDFRQTAPLGWIELRDITAADLPDALCRVMLASLKVSEVQP